MIKLVLLDVDGTLTDGGIYRGNNGEDIKKFNVKDGYTIVNAQKVGIEFGIITGKVSQLVKNRAEELKIKYLYQNVADKVIILNEIMQKEKLSAEEIAYIGDDYNDLRIMKNVGLSGAPKDAAEEVLKIADFISTQNGGEGAVRDFVEFIMKKDGKLEKFFDNIK